MSQCSSSGWFESAFIRSHHLFWSWWKFLVGKRMWPEVMAPYIIYLNHWSSLFFFPLSSVSCILSSQKISSFVTTKKPTSRIMVKTLQECIKEIEALWKLKIYSFSWWVTTILWNLNEKNQIFHWRCSYNIILSKDENGSSNDDCGGLKVNRPIASWNECLVLS